MILENTYMYTIYLNITDYKSYIGGVFSQC